MIDLQLIRKDSQAVAAALAKKGAIVSFDELLEWDKERRALIAEVETLKARRNKVSGEIPLYKKQGKDTTEIFKEMREIGDKISASDARIAEVEGKMNDFLARLPNLPDDDVVAGEKENNQVVRIEGEKPVFDFEPQNHVDLCTKLGLIDYELGVKLGGGGYWIYRNMGARLEWV